MANRYPGAVLVSVMMHGGVVLGLVGLAYAWQRADVAPTPVFVLSDYWPTNVSSSATVAPASITGPVINPPVNPRLTPGARPAERNDPSSSPKITREPSVPVATLINRSRPAVPPAPAPSSLRTMSKEAFDALNQRSTAAPAPAAPKFRKIDLTQLGPTGVDVKGDQPATTKVGDSTAAVVDSADAWENLLRALLRENLRRPARAIDNITVTVTLRALPDGTLDHAHVIESSGDPDFDAAAIDAISRTRMPVRPDSRSVLLTIPFRLRNEDR